MQGRGDVSSMRLALTGLFLEPNLQWLRAIGSAAIRNRVTHSRPEMQRAAIPVIFTGLGFYTRVCARVETYPLR